MIGRQEEVVIQIRSYLLYLFHLHNLLFLKPLELFVRLLAHINTLLGKELINNEHEVVYAEAHVINLC